MGHDGRALQNLDLRPPIDATITVRSESLTAAVRDAEDKLATIGAFNIRSCDVSGADGLGWSVTLRATSCQ